MMPEPILCHVCGHDIDVHDLGECCDCPGSGRGCHQWVSDIARAYADERMREVMDSHRCDEQAERAYQGAVTAEADAGRLHSVRDEVVAEATLARQAYRSCKADHFAHDYCRWVGMSEAYQNVLNILDRGDDE